MMKRSNGRKMAQKHWKKGVKMRGERVGERVAEKIYVRERKQKREDK